MGLAATLMASDYKVMQKTRTKVNNIFDIHLTRTLPIYILIDAGYRMRQQASLRASWILYHAFCIMHHPSTERSIRAEPSAFC